MQTHPLDCSTPRVRSINRADVPKEKTYLRMRVSRHPNGGWQLRVLTDGQVIEDRIFSAETVGRDEWLDVTVDLSKIAGHRIPLSNENRAKNWHNEWAYWNKVEVVTE